MIDEDQSSRESLGAQLVRQNHFVQKASSGREGYIIALRDRPDMIVLDTSLGDIPALELVRKLRSDKRSSTAVLIALAAVSNSAQKDDLLAAGCSRFFLKTQESIDIFIGLLATPVPLQQTGSLKKHRSDGFLGVFLSARGGMGTSSLCANVAQNISTTFPELDVAVMDLVLPIGSIASIVGHQGDFDILTSTSLAPADLNGDSLRLWLTPLENWRFRFLAGSPDPEIASSLDSSHFLGVTRAFRQVCDLTLVDLGSSLSGANLAIIQEADVVVLVINTDHSTASTTKIVWKYLQQKGVRPQRVYTLINRPIGLDNLSKSEIESIIGLEIRAVIPDLGRAISLANSQHLPLQVKLPNEPAALLIKQISTEILETARHNRT